MEEDRIKEQCAKYRYELGIEDINLPKIWLKPIDKILETQEQVTEDVS